MSTTYNRTTIVVRCKAFASDGVATNLVRIDHDGSLTVWDSVAGAYTSCHAIGPRSARRILAKHGSVCPAVLGDKPADLWQ